MGEYTPGKWLLAEGNCSALVYALDETGDVNRFTAQVGGGYSYSGRTVKERTDHEEVLANARLIAAAPELLEALVALEREASEFAKAIPPYSNSEPLAAARAAISKATGSTLTGRSS